MLPSSLMSRTGPPGEHDARPPAPPAEDEPTTRLVRGQLPPAGPDDEDQTAPIPVVAVRTVLAQRGAAPPEQASEVIPPPRRARAGRTEGEPVDGSVEVVFDESGAAVARVLGRPRPPPLTQEQGDASVDVVFDPTTGELIAKEIKTILEDIPSDAEPPPPPVDPLAQPGERASDPDIHRAQIEYDPDKTRRNVRR
jgi:hypothetical protein